jgi:hypothetical protein
MTRARRVLSAVLMGVAVIGALGAPASAGPGGSRRPIEPGFSQPICRTECRWIYYNCPIQNGMICRIQECKLVCR